MTQSASTITHFPSWAQETRKERPPSSLQEYLVDSEAFFDHYAASVEYWRKRNASYHRKLASLARFYVTPQSRVLELGSGAGDLLAAVDPSGGVGIDVSGEMVRLARKRHPGLEFRQMAAENLDLGSEKFDYVILSDLNEFLFDIRLVFDKLRPACHPGTRVVLNWYSKLWQPLLGIAEKAGMKYPQPLLNWTTVEDISNLLYLAGFEVIQHQNHILMPFDIPVIGSLANRILAHLPLFNLFCLTNWTVARPLSLNDCADKASVSIICPCRNEAGNIQEIVDRLPSIGSHTELIFVEGHSRDGTLDACRRAAQATPEKDIRVFEQEGRGKGDAVRLGFSHAKGDVLMILDADLSVAPESLPDFYEALTSGKSEFVNGSRLVYTMDSKAMRFLNLLGNRFFALLLSKLMGQSIKDSLCGTKVMWRSKYEELSRRRSYFGNVDPFGDFDLLFGAAKLNLKIVEIPVRYRQRRYGSTNISRFADGALLLRMCFKAAKTLYFVS